MEQEKLNFFKDLLIQERQQHEQVLNNMKKNNMGSQDKESAGELSSYDNHPAELASEVFETEHNMALEVSEEFHIREIDDALERIEQGNYGKCELCGKPIGEGRLEVLPYARLCIDCEEKRQLSSEFLNRSRPNEEKVIDAPFGRKYLNEQEDDEYEGMDQLNDLMKYGSASSPQDMGGYHDYKEFYTNEVDEQGEVDEIEQISNEDYKKQLPD